LLYDAEIVDNNTRVSSKVKGCSTKEEAIKITAEDLLTKLMVPKYKPKCKL
jgi:hypothetical protein